MQQATRILRLLAVIGPASAEAPLRNARPAGRAHRVRPGAAVDGRRAPRRRRAGGGRVRFQATHKLMSYLLVATALATLASSEALGAARRCCC